jgi:very-short-patch-repair endonuclease
VVEVDGPEHSKNENFKYDEIRTKFFEGLDIKTIRFSNFEVNKNINNVLENIQTELNSPSLWRRG